MVLATGAGAKAAAEAMAAAKMTDFMVVYLMIVNSCEEKIMVGGDASRMRGLCLPKQIKRELKWRSLRNWESIGELSFVTGIYSSHCYNISK